jgi:hypothetical protein
MLKKKYKINGSGRVVALINFSDVKEGDIGGFVMKESQLSHEGNAWVYGNARVCDNAQVCGNARVLNNAKVYGNAWNKSPLYIQGSVYSLTNSKYGYITIGCLTLTFKQWKGEGLKIAKEHNFTEEQIEEYKAYIELFTKIGK